MPETPESGTSSTNKCSATTDASMLNTSDVIARPNSKSAKTTRSKRPVSDMNVSSARREPLPRYLSSELCRLTFKLDGKTYQADETEQTFAWTTFIANYADVTGAIDWEDLEERAHFLNMLYEFCEAQGIPFPFEDSEAENGNERFNAR